jgi:hypothetical protein
LSCLPATEPVTIARTPEHPLMNSPSPRFYRHQLLRGIALIPLLGAALFGSTGCTLHSPLRSVQALPPDSGWAEVLGPMHADLGSGITLEMPQGPYRARFSDTRGIYYQASLPLIYRSTMGTTTSTTGGVYVLHGEPDRARSWSEPILASPSVSYSQWFSVRVFNSP